MDTVTGFSITHDAFEPDESAHVLALVRRLKHLESVPGSVAEAELAALIWALGIFGVRLVRT